MTAFHAPERPCLGNGLPCRLRTQIALPELCLRPLPNGQWRVRLMHTVDNVGSWVTCDLAADRLPALLATWSADPEAVLKYVFKIS